jgi:hypothetical protein
VQSDNTNTWHRCGAAAAAILNSGFVWVLPERVAQGRLAVFRRRDGV